MNRARNAVNRLTELIGGNQPIVVKGSLMNPNVGLSLGQYLYHNAKSPTCFTVRYPKSIIIGNFQLAQAECNLSRLKEDGVQLVRRGSGGGAVYIDEGNCMFSLTGSLEQLTQPIAHKILCKGIDSTFSVQSRFTGKNDVKVDDFKVAGWAYNMKGSENSRRLLAHACILVDSDLSRLPIYLTPNQKKLASHGTASVDQRVTNLVRFNPNKSVSDLEKTLIEEFLDQFPPSTHSRSEITVEMDEAIALSIPEVKQTYLEMSDKARLLRKINAYNMRISHKFSFGFVELF